MQTDDLAALKRATTILDELVMARYVDLQGPAQIGMTDFGHLSETEQQEERDNVRDHDLGHRARAAIHLCLSASSVALEASARLMGEFADLACDARIKLLSECAEDTAAASEALAHASAVLNEEEEPQTEPFFEMSRFRC
jgi:hypothetical protein